ncbi:MAG: hypothetical protein IT557_13535 [Alphaproteobacteria bacterium]|nr:hypothetical protein [Alphaproteobacteria bacterium]
MHAQTLPEPASIAASRPPGLAQALPDYPRAPQSAAGLAGGAAGAMPPLRLSARVRGRRVRARLDPDGRLRLHAMLARAPFTAENLAARRGALALFLLLRRRAGWSGRLALAPDATLELAAEARLPVARPGSALLVELVRFALAVRLLAGLIDEGLTDEGRPLNPGRELPEPGRDRSGWGCGSGRGSPGRSR